VHSLDRSFIGITAEGINRELASTLESAAFCRKYTTCKSLAIPETAILRIADSVPEDMIPHNILQLAFLGSNRTEHKLSWREILRGILPSLRYVIERDSKFYNGPSKKIIINDLPDSHVNAAHHGIDPYGNDYFCRICSHELANTYFHCNGCEVLLAKDYNICIDCYKEEAFATNVAMNQWNNASMACHFHHVGKPKRQCTSSLEHNMNCSECLKCLFCNCICHTIFQKRYRFYTEERQRSVLDCCTQLIHGDEIKYSCETECQLNGKPMIPMSDHTLTPSTPLDIGQGVVIKDSRYTDVEVIPTKENGTNNRPKSNVVDASPQFLNCYTGQVQLLDHADTCIPNHNPQVDENEVEANSLSPSATPINVSTPTVSNICANHLVKSTTSYPSYKIPISTESLEYDAV
jgi:hypothetical protein